MATPAEIADWLFARGERTRRAFEQHGAETMFYWLHRLRLPDEITDAADATPASVTTFSRDDAIRAAVQAGTEFAVIACTFPSHPDHTYNRRENA